jgi:Ni/Co efflux regulator RcnB
VLARSFSTGYPEENNNMRKIVLALAAVAAVGLTVPMVSAPAEARHGTKVVVIKHKHHWDRGRHTGWNRGHHYGWRNHHHHGHGARVVIR